MSQIGVLRFKVTNTSYVICLNSFACKMRSNVGTFKMCLSKKAKKGFLKRVIKYFKVLAGLALLLSTAFCNSRATFKYLAKPVSTSISFTHGDDDDGNIRFPAVTICNAEVQHLMNHVYKELREKYCDCGNPYSTKCKKNFHTLFTFCRYDKDDSIGTTTTTEASDYNLFDLFGGGSDDNEVSKRLQ